MSEQTVSIVVAYCDWLDGQSRFETVEEARQWDQVCIVPARVTRTRYILRYGGETKAMESGNGNVRKLLCRFYRSGEAMTSWRHTIGSHERGTRKVIRFSLVAQ